MYGIYIDYRARGFRPIVANMATLQVMETGVVHITDLEQLSKEYKYKPIFGMRV